MLTRPGANPGPEWMRNLGDRLADARQFRKTMWRIFLFFGILQVGSILVSRMAVYKNSDRHVGVYNSAIRIGGLPLLSVGGRPHGIIAVGGVATGVIAIGGLAAGVIACGGLSVGVFAIGGLATGGLALAGIAVGWRALGGLAIGHAAFGGLAIGRYAYAGEGVALGYDEASGKQKESLFG